VALENFINVGLIKSPINWVIVWLMVLMAVALLGLLIPATAPAQDV